MSTVRKNITALFFNLESDSHAFLAKHEMKAPLAFEDRMHMKLKMKKTKTYPHGNVLILINGSPVSTIVRVKVYLAVRLQHFKVGCI